MFCIIGDGSFIMNIQDLQSIVQEQINLKIIIINNNEVSIDIKRENSEI